MASKNVLELIETAYEVEKLQLADGTPVWPFLRQAVYFQIQQKTVQYSNKLRTRNKLQLFKNFFYGIKYLFNLKKFEYLFFNNTSKRELLDDKYFDIYYDAWTDILGQNKSLFIEWAIEAHLPKQNVHSSHIISDLPFKFWSKLISFSTNVDIQHIEILEAILKEYAISFDPKKEVKNNLAEYHLYRKLFRIIKPKVVFVLSSFTKMGIVYAAKQLNIPVYEPQHGFMGSTHPFYNAVKKFPEFYPDKLLSFGASEKEENATSFIFKPQQILPVGSLQLALVKQREIPPVLVSAKQHYKMLFCVTLQAIKDEEILKWLEIQAKNHSDWLFIIRPKQPNFNLKLYTIMPNIVTMPEATTYDVLKAANYNITIFSTTVIEGIYLGAKPILYNVDSLPYKYFDLENADIAVIENNEMITNQHLVKEGTFRIPYFVNDYFDNVAKHAACF